MRLVIFALPGGGFTAVNPDHVVRVVQGDHFMDEDGDRLLNRTDIVSVNGSIKVEGGLDYVRVNLEHPD